MRQALTSLGIAFISLCLLTDPPLDESSVSYFVIVVAVSGASVVDQESTF